LNRLTKYTVFGAAIALVAGSAIMFNTAEPTINEPTIKAQPGSVVKAARALGPECLPVGQKTRPGQPKSYCGGLPTLAAVNIREARLDIVTDKLQLPWAFEFMDDNRVLLTEFKGALKQLNISDGEIVNISGLPEISTGKGQRGLLDVVLHPEFEQNHLIYLSYVIQKPNEERFATAVSRAELIGSRLENVEEIFVAQPFEKSSSNFGGALVYGTDGFLYIGLGDRSKREHAQRGDYTNGKIVRIKDDGTIPGSNPFIDDKNGIHPAIYALGVRNPQGLVQDKITNILYETEHGPMGGDEVNIIRAGRNYGWPVISYGMNYTYEKIGLGTEKDLFEQPLYYYLPSIALSPIEIYRGEMFKEWDGHLLVGGLRARTVSKLDLHNGQIKSEVRILAEVDGRVRDIKVASDGSIWILVEQGKLYRLWRDARQPTDKVVAGKRTGKQVYLSVCSSCHSQNTPGIPRLAVKEDWQTRIGKGKKVLYANSINGFNAMPEKGQCDDCSDREIRAAVDYMIKQVR